MAQHNPHQARLMVIIARPDSNPAEKAIMYRLFLLLKLNVQLIFVFDGEGKGRKTGEPAGAARPESTRLFKELLRHLGVPFHMAPAEAEAECVRLEQLGIVDAVWSEDSDFFMFGGTNLVRFHREGKGKARKSNDFIDRYTAGQILDTYGLERARIVLFAIISGCDYTKGIPGAALHKSLQVAKTVPLDLAEAMCKLFVKGGDKIEMNKWKTRFRFFMSDPKFKQNFLVIPKDFPDIDVVSRCYSPTVSADERLRSLPCTGNGWSKSFAADLAPLITFLQGHFNSTLKITWPVPHLTAIELNRMLILRLSLAGVEVKLKNREGPESSVLIRPWKILPGLENIYGDEPKSNDEVECKLLDCVLRRGLPTEMNVQAAEVKRGRKRKARDVEGDDSGPASKRKTKSPRQPQKPTGSAQMELPSNSLQQTLVATPKAGLKTTKIPMDLMPSPPRTLRPIPVHGISWSQLGSSSESQPEPLTSVGFIDLAADD
ncbi:PIN domain-like protein [Cercophora scortea]|uniref:PIN domain-like protein n=1 Tax=Cercophora scortea TaxID=314031 RepID=A0AAE0J506_9PEZI|nr:PIN domain-like protein [Cercophora scortea]